ncbi:hypothetical protein [Oceanidesulfovibrio marinus]|uniref:Uncharacterized protein n=1 Tax=Oceanidesulfovibrio marinus TaxID=370038 RepID=A0A6P1ZJD4_9BACT|nr:hypothetical protein [Oceanidesulfovibrio marinus]TVM35703.1 hypothetical protein DQK91_03285 [Oceanidesulfovibrio marinus]
MRYVLLAWAMLIALSCAAPVHAQSRLDRGLYRRYPNRYDDAPSPLVRRWREERHGGRYAPEGPYVSEDNATGNATGNATDNSTATAAANATGNGMDNAANDTARNATGDAGQQ